MRKVAVLTLLLLLSLTASAQSISVSDAMVITSTAGEAQSTVVPPGHPQCQNGRFLVTNDRVAPPNSVVSGRDLNLSTGTTITSNFSNMGALAANFDADMEKSKYFFGTNDHDLVTLPNGDVLYLTGAFSRMPHGPAGGRPLPIYMSQLLKDTYRNICRQWDASGNCVNQYAFGPNTRSVMLVFRSKDCGASFQFVSEMDPLRFGGATCGLPQFNRDASNALITSKPWDMGGTDGQLVTVDPSNGNLYMTFQCVGYLPDSQGSNPVLDKSKKINQTLVLVSDTGGTSWKYLGYINQAAWRFSVVPRPGGELLFGFASSVLTGTRDTKGSYTFDSTGTPAPGANWTWMSWWDFNDPNIPFKKGTHANVMAVPVVARAPGGKSVVLAFPDKFGDKGFGYRVFFYDPTKTTPFAESDPILPANAGKSNLAFHLVVADPGKGPVLLYWTDFDAAAKQATIRGRFITGEDEFSDDRVISRAAGADHSFPIPVSYWIGDYHTAGAVARRVGQVAGQGQFQVDLRRTRYDFYPMWVEADGSVHYATVEYALDPLLIGRAPNKKVTVMKPLRVPVTRWRPRPRPVELRLIPHPVEREPERPRKVGLPDPVPLRRRP